MDMGEVTAAAAAAEMDMENLTKIVKENRSAIDDILKLAMAGVPLNSTQAMTIKKSILKTQIGGKKRKSIKKKKSTKRRRPTKKRR